MTPQKRIRDFAGYYGLTNMAVHGNFGTPKHKEAAGKEIGAAAAGFTSFFCRNKTWQDSGETGLNCPFSDVHNRYPAPCNPS
jgi:hypothetical protein